MKAHIVVRTLPLARDYDEGEIVEVVERGKEFKMRLIQGALKGEREILAVPTEGVKH